MNRQKQIRTALVQRATIIASIRRFFNDNGFLEVETPVRIPAPAPEAHIDAVSTDGWFLHTSPELCMKRLLSSGYERIFQICKCFRKGERGGRHLPEMTLLEWYGAGMDYLMMMEETMHLVRYAAHAAGHGDTLAYKGKNIDLSPPWITLTVSEAFNRFSDKSLHDALANDWFDEIIAFEIEPALAGMEKPVFLCDYPLEKGALAREKKDTPEGMMPVAERFELYLFGIELCNAFSELTDPVIQRQRFEEELNFREKAGKSVYPMPEPFLSTLADMPESSGNALGVDRLVMIFTGAENIDGVTAFTPEEL